MYEAKQSKEKVSRTIEKKISSYETRSFGMAKAIQLYPNFEIISTLGNRYRNIFINTNIQNINNVQNGYHRTDDVPAIFTRH